MLVLGIVGWSGSGKTSLIEALIQQFRQTGLRVNVIKHSHHDVTLEPAHKDSARFRRSGANEVLLASPFRYALIHELAGQDEPSLAGMLDRLSPADLCLVEGYKWADIAKIEVYRPSVEKRPLYLETQTTPILAVASDVPRMPDCPAQIAWLDLNQSSEVGRWIAENLIHPQVQEKASDKEL